MQEQDLKRKFEESEGDEEMFRKGIDEGSSTSPLLKENEVCDCLWISGNIRQEFSTLDLGDIFKHLPFEIIQFIFSHIKPQKICDLQLVNKSWYKFLREDPIWSSLCKQENIEEMKPMKCTKCFFKENYLNDYRS